MSLEWVWYVWGVYSVCLVLMVGITGPLERGEVGKVNLLVGADGVRDVVKCCW